MKKVSEYLFTHANVFTDRLSTEFSTSPYGKSDLEHMVNVVKEMEEGAIQGGGSPSSLEYTSIIRL